MERAACLSVLPIIATKVSARTVVVSEEKDDEEGPNETTAPVAFTRSVITHCQILRNINASSAPIPESYLKVGYNYMVILASMLTYQQPRSPPANS